jgi:Fe-S oxidoreductase/coenzyme F420-reducing hydrogenase delta subunit
MNRLDINARDTRKTGEMESAKIICFLCQWAPHNCVQALQESSIAWPEELYFVRIPCTGRITKALLFKAFEMGADGVALLGCAEGSCRYGTGTETARRNVEQTREILDLLGFGGMRLQWRTFLPQDELALKIFIVGFVEQIASMGKVPVRAAAPPVKSRPVSREVVDRMLTEYKVWACQDCGKCAAACSLALVGKHFSPRAVSQIIMSKGVGSPEVHEAVWSCLTCGRCEERCPSDVRYVEFIRHLREHLKQNGFFGHPSHGGFLHSLMRTMAVDDLKQRRWDWLPDDIKTEKSGEVMFFGGCAPFFDAFFSHHLAVPTREILTASLRLLNFFDVHPVLLENERCCGHDLLWTGDRENFERLAKANLEEIRDHGVKTVITGCPECFFTWSRDYPELAGDQEFEVVHLYDFLDQEISKGGVSFKPFDRRVTYQDPCRLGRLSGKYEVPRRLMERIPFAGFQEMAERGPAAPCCGNCGWTNCDSFAKAVQVDRLRQASATGSDLLVTACPKCQVHLKCAMEDPHLHRELEMEMLDLAQVLERTIEWSE